MDNPKQQGILYGYLDSENLIKAKMVHKSWIAECENDNLDTSVRLFEQKMFLETISESLKNDVRNRHSQFWRQVVKEEFSKNPANSKSTLLHYAAAFDEVEVIKKLLKDGAKVNAVDEFSRTPLMMSCEGLKGNSAAILLKNGAKHTIRNKNGKTCLQIVDEPHISIPSPERHFQRQKISIALGSKKADFVDFVFLCSVLAMFLVTLWKLQQSIPFGEN
jgi:ankyrin repeat protein